MHPADPAFREAERAATRYPFDPIRAAALLAEAGWRAARPGAAATNAATLDMELWTTAGSGADQEAAVIIDGWKAAGMSGTMLVIASARQKG